MNKSLKSVGLVLLLVAAVTVALVVRNLRTAPQALAPTSQEVAVTTPVSDSPLPTPPPSEKPLAPDCELTVKPASTDEKRAEALPYEFEPPRVIATNTTGFEMVSWLPDSRRILYSHTRATPDGTMEEIFTLHVETGEMQAYGERKPIYDADPVWLEAQQAVAYTEQSADKRYRLLMSKGDGQVTEMVDNLTTSHLAGGGDALVFFAGEQGELPELYQVEQQSFQPWQFSLLQEIRQDGREQAIQYLTPYQIAIQPANHQAVFYNNNGLYLADLTQQTSCYLDLGKETGNAFPVWPFYAKWSPDGRQLAMLTTSEDYMPAYNLSLTLLNIQDGTMRSIRPDYMLQYGQTAGAYYVSGIGWSPDSQTLLVTAVVRDDEYAHLYLGLFGMTLDGKLTRLLPDDEFGSGDFGSMIDWSPDGQYIAVNCPTIKEGRLCLINVKYQ